MVQKPLQMSHKVDKIRSTEVAVYDPSNRTSNGYWNWANIEVDDRWDRVVSRINQTYSNRIRDFKGEAEDVVIYGVLNEGHDHPWLYRIYLGGRDRFGRPGRHFFVVFRLNQPSQILHPEVSGVLRYFDGERSLPLNTDPLDHGLPQAEPDSILKKLYEHWVKNRRTGHWGMDGKGEVTIFTTEKPIPAQETKVSPEATKPGGLSGMASRSRRSSGYQIPILLKIGFAIFGLLIAGIGLTAVVFFGAVVTAIRGCSDGPDKPSPPPVETASTPGNKSTESSQPNEHELTDSERRDKEAKPDRETTGDRKSGQPQGEDIR